MWYLQQRLRVGPRMLYGKWGQFDSNKMPSSSLLLQCGRKMTKKKKSDGTGRLQAHLPETGLLTNIKQK